MRVSRIVGLYIRTIDFSCLFYSLPQPWSLRLYNVFSGIPVNQPFKIWALVFVVVFYCRLTTTVFQREHFAHPHREPHPRSGSLSCCCFLSLPTSLCSHLNLLASSQPVPLLRKFSPLSSAKLPCVVLTGRRHFLCSKHPWLIKHNHNLSYRNWCLRIENENNGAAGVGVLCPSCRPVRPTT